MSILIKMEMPKNCGECPLRSEVIMPLRCKGVYGEPPIYTTEELPNEKALMSKRHSMCPLIEVPPHGDLIDADAAMKAACEALCHLGVFCPDNLCKEVRETFDAVPTIIESEE